MHLLNEINDEIKAIHKFSKNQKILIDQAKLSFQDQNSDSKKTTFETKNSFKDQLRLRKRFEQKNEFDESKSSYLMKDSSTFEYTNDFSNASYSDIDFDDSIDSINDNILSKILLKFKIIKKFRQRFFKLFKEKQKNFDQKLFNFRHLLILDSEKIYIIEDLKYERILNRVLRLLYLTRFEK